MNRGIKRIARLQMEIACNLYFCRKSRLHEVEKCQIYIYSISLKPKLKPDSNRSDWMHRREHRILRGQYVNISTSILTSSHDKELAENVSNQFLAQNRFTMRWNKKGPVQLNWWEQYVTTKLPVVHADPLNRCEDTLHQATHRNRFSEFSRCWTLFTH